MFNIDNEYTFSQTKNELGDNGSGAMLNDSEKLLAVCLDNSINHIAKNLMLIKKESLIRKIGRDLAATQSSTHLFIKKIQIKKIRGSHHQGCCHEEGIVSRASGGRDRKSVV